MAERADQITYWHTIRAAQIAHGEAGDYSPDTITAGDLVKLRHHGWVPVLRVNKKTVSVHTPAPFGGRLIRHTVPYAEIQGHRTPSDTPEISGPPTPTCRTLTGSCLATLSRSVTAGLVRSQSAIAAKLCDARSARGRFHSTAESVKPPALAKERMLAPCPLSPDLDTAHDRCSTSPPASLA